MIETTITCDLCGITKSCKARIGDENFTYAFVEDDDGTKLNWVRAGFTSLNGDFVNLLYDHICESCYKQLLEYCKKFKEAN